MALGTTLDGQKDVLGLWMEGTEGAKFWLKVLNELISRGVKDVLIACVDGLKGFPEALHAAFPGAIVQGCAVHMIRNACAQVGRSERKDFAGDLKEIYRAVDEGAAMTALQNLAQKWDPKYLAISRSWLNNWEIFVPFLSFPLEVRKMIYTTNAIESLNDTSRDSVKTRGHFPSDEAVFKVLYLALQRHQKNWKRPPRDWQQARAQFHLLYAERIQNALGSL